MSIGKEKNERNHWVSSLLHTFRQWCQKGVVILALLGSADLWGQNPALMDRLVVEVNSQPFTQRQVEIYLTMKRSLQAEAKGPVVLISADNWRAGLEEFLGDMLIEQEAQRLNTFQASPAQIDVAEQFVDKRAAQDQGLSRFVQDKGVSRSRMRQALASVLRVKGFILSRQKIDGGGAKGGAGKDDMAPLDWMVEIEQRIPYRFFEGARQWQVIKPLSSGGERRD